MTSLGSGSKAQAHWLGLVSRGHLIKGHKCDQTIIELQFGTALAEMCINPASLKNLDAVAISFLLGTILQTKN